MKSKVYMQNSNQIGYASDSAGGLVSERAPLCREGDTHLGNALPGKADSIFLASRNTVEGLLRDDNPAQADIKLPSLGQPDEFLQWIEKLLHSALASQGGMNELYLKSLANVYWIYAARKHLSISETQGRRHYAGLPPYLLTRVKEYMSSNIANRVTLEELASIANLSPSHFRRAFQKTVGVPPHHYLLKLRVATAERLLVETKFTLSEIAQGCGFASQSHITRVMKQFCGATPGQIRRTRAKAWNHMETDNPSLSPLLSLNYDAATRQAALACGQAA